MKSASSFVRHLFFSVVAFVTVVAVVSAARAQQKTAKSDDAAITARLQQLLDKEEIQQVLLDYGRYLDNRDFAGYASLFAKDGQWVGGFGTVAAGDIKAFMEKAMGTQNTAKNYHLLSNFVIDTLVREDGQWRFKRGVASNDTAPPSR